MRTANVLSERMSSPLNLDRLYDDHAQALFAFLLNLLRNEADTRDVIQELFVKLARNPGLFHGVRDQRAFMLRLAHNLAIDLMRRRAAREKNLQQLAADRFPLFVVAPDPDAQEFDEKLTDALGELPAEQRAVVHLKLWERMTFEQIAEALEIPANTAASRYRYGIDKLRERLRPLYDDIK